MVIVDPCCCPICPRCSSGEIVKHDRLQKRLRMRCLKCNKKFWAAILRSGKTPPKARYLKQDGLIVRVFNVNKFCKEYNLCSAAIYDLLNARFDNSQGFKRSSAEEAIRQYFQGKAVQFYS